MKKKILDPLALESVARIFKALCEPVRLRILQELQETERTVSELCLSVGTSQPNLSKHLKTLVDAGLLKRRQEANFCYYSISAPMVYQICDTICNGIQEKLTAHVQAFSGLDERPREKTRVKRRVVS